VMKGLKRDRVLATIDASDEGAETRSCASYYWC